MFETRNAATMWRTVGVRSYISNSEWLLYIVVEMALAQPFHLKSGVLCRDPATSGKVSE